MSNVSGLCLDCISLLTPPPNHESTHSVRAAELLCCNDPPSDSELAAFKHDIAGWESVVADLEQRIARVQTFLDSLAEARTNAEARLKDAKALLRPICRMPNEIMMQIFSSCIPESPYNAKDYDSSDSRTIPWTLTRVCQRWRNLARSMPSLWSQVKVGFTGYYPIMTRTVKSFLRMSRDVPLSVYVRSREGLDSLRGSEHRWKSLRTSLGKEDYRSLEGTHFPALGILYAGITARPGQAVDVFTASTAPNLRTLIASSALLTHLNLPWSQLTSLTVWDEFRPRLMPLLERMTVLEHVKLNVSSKEISGPIILPRVSSLDLTERANLPTGSLKKLLECMTLPMLSDLSLLFNDPIPEAPRDTYYPTALNSAGHLTTLCIDVEMAYPATNVENLLDFLSLTPHVKALTIRNSYLTEPFLLGMTRVAGKVCRLPNMTSLDIGENGALLSSYVVDGTPEAALCKMIESRMTRGGGDTNEGQSAGAVLGEVCMPRWAYREDKIWSSERWASVCSAVKIFCCEDLHDIYET